MGESDRKGNMKALLGLLAALLVDHGDSKPIFGVPPTLNLGTPIVVDYKFTDSIDGRFMTVTGSGASGTGKFASTTGNDWIGLFKKGDCANTLNNQDRHKCYVAWEYVPQGKSVGQVTFGAHKYKNAGDYEVRYFYGDDPTIPGAYQWMGQGFVCNTWLDTTGNNVLDTYDGNVGYEGSPATTNVELAQCQCDPALASQSITLASGTAVTITQEQCGKYRAACGRCALDAASTSSTVTIVGTAGIDVYQDMAALPGFEIAF